MNTQEFKRKLTAVFSADVAGYSRLMGEDEAATVKTLESYKQVMFSLIRQHRGRVIDSPGDNLLAEFASVVDAVQCGVAVQKELQARNAELPENRKMQFRIGINLGDVIEEQDRIYGDGVNIAARLESCADPGGICVSKTAFDHIETKLPLGYEYLGEKEVKNIAKPVGAYRVLMEPRVTVAGAKEKKPSIPVWRTKGALAVAAAVLVVIIGVAVWNFYWRVPKFEPASKEKMAFPLPDKPSIAVLPFDNISGDREQDYIADGIAENIISHLSKIPEMFVIDRKSSSTYKGKQVKVQQVSEDLGVRYILEGSVQKSGNKLRITAQLVDALKGHQLWSERYDRDFLDLFAIQDEVTANIIKAMGVHLTAAQFVRQYDTTNIEAWGYTIKAANLNGQVKKEASLEARSLAEKALKLDPSYAWAWNVLAWTYTLEGWQRWTDSPADSFRRAMECAKQEEATGKSRGSFHNILCLIYVLQGKYDEAIAEGEKAVAAEPNEADNNVFVGSALLCVGRPNEAIVYLKKAIRLNPYYPAFYLLFLGPTYEMAGQYSEALATCKRLLERSLKGEFPPLLAHQWLVITYARLGEMEKARAHADEMLKINSKYTADFFRNTYRIKDRAYLDDLVSLLIKAGLPDKPPLPLPDKPSIAVLPFVNMSGDSKDEYLADGFTDQIISSISRADKILVIARTSTFVYKGKAVKVQKVAEELGVRYVLEGSVQKSGDRVRVTAQLIDALSGHHLWSDKYDRELRDILALQDEITMKIVYETRVELTEGEQARVWMRKGQTNNLKAFEKNMQGLVFVRRGTKQDNDTARRFFEEAIAIDENYIWPYVNLGWTHCNDARFTWGESPAKSLQMAYELAEKTLAMDESNDLAHSLLGSCFLVMRQYDKAIAEGERAVALNPNGAEAYYILADIAGCSGRWDESVSHIKRSIRLDPMPRPIFHRILGRAYFMMGQYDEAIVALNKALQISPDFLLAHISLAACYSSMGRDEEATTAAKEVLRIAPKFSVETYARILTLKNKPDIEREVAALRKAGLK